MICVDYNTQRVFDAMEVETARSDFPRFEQCESTNKVAIDLPEQVWKFIFDFLTLKECATVASVCSEWRRIVWSSKYELIIPNKFKTYELLFTDEHMKWVPQHCTQLRTLDLSGIYGVTDEGIVHIGSLKNLMNLSVARCTRFSYQSLAKALCVLESLQSLNVSWCTQITDEFYELLSSSFPLKNSLNHLDSSFQPQLTNESLYFMSNFGRLQSLALNGCEQLTRKGFEELLPFLPRLAYLEVRWVPLKERSVSVMRPSQLLHQHRNRRDPVFGASYCSSPNGSPRPLNVSHIKLEKESIPKMVSFAYSNDHKLQLEALIGFRKLLSIESGPPIDEVIQSGVIPRLIDLLRVNDPMVQFESAWTLTNIASGTTNQTQVLISHGIIPVFIQLAQSKDIDVKSQAVWTLGNISGDSTASRDLVIDEGALPVILESISIAKQIGNPSLLRHSSWCLSNMCRGSPNPNIDKIKAAIPYLLELLHYPDEEVAADSCWSLSYLAGGDEQDIQKVVQLGVLPHIMSLLTHSSSALVAPALRTVGNIATGSDLQTQTLLDMSLLPLVGNLLGTQTTKKNILKEACWTLSNITAGPTHHIQAVIDANLFPRIIELLKNPNTDFEVRKECTWVIGNSTMAATSKQIEYFVSLGCIAPMCQMLDTADDNLCSVVLEALRNIILHDRQKYLRLVEQSVDNDYLEDISTTGAEDVASKASELLDWLNEL